MKIQVSLKLVLLKNEQELEVEPGTGVGRFVEKFLEGCGDEARRLMIDKEGRLNVLTLVNGRAAKMDQELREGDRVVFVGLVSGG